MGKVIIHPETTIAPISLIGQMAAICWRGDSNDATKNYERGWGCIMSGHDRVLEFPEIYFTLEGYSARVIREFYTHIGGAPTRLQESTRYVDYKQFAYITPASIIHQSTESNSNLNAQNIYRTAMEAISYAMQQLELLGIPKEDIAMLLPLGMETKITVKMNLRTLISMAHQRLCSRAYWEYRQLMQDLIQALNEYSTDWKEITSKFFVPKCIYLGYCPEKNSCGLTSPRVLN